MLYAPSIFLRGQLGNRDLNIGGNSETWCSKVSVLTAEPLSLFSYSKISIKSNPHSHLASFDGHDLCFSESPDIL